MSQSNPKVKLALVTPQQIMQRFEKCTEEENRLNFNSKNFVKEEPILEHRFSARADPERKFIN